MLSATGLNRETSFMIDTGAAPNVIKKRNLTPEILIRDDTPLYLSGITSGRIETLGSIELIIMNHPVFLYIVPDNFPIAQEGILGSDFLPDATSINLLEKHVEWRGNRIPFSEGETITVPARSQSNFYLRVVTSPHIFAINSKHTRCASHIFATKNKYTTHYNTPVIISIVITNLEIRRHTYLRKQRSILSLNKKYNNKE
ncbi:hypothetical protein ALC60_11414 [Trachymyrmex zeteki]|uniref:Peptidase A2 domain-containing protein n=1 Tax=Mycetomoellerius zeteki TaxID=64791 RepID=A0A151WNX0_9HYME|nr:hypothetical protein ALC60_11414 [Trachymyrmex zeteki]